MKYRFINIFFLIGIVITLTACGNKKVDVKVNTSEEAVQKIENQATFILVIGESICGTCQDLKEDSLSEYVKKYGQSDLILLYKDKSFANTTEFYDFLTTYGIDFESSPTTYFFKEGQYKTKFEGYKTLGELEEFISDNKASE